MKLNRLTIIIVSLIILIAAYFILDKYLINDVNTNNKLLGNWEGVLNTPSNRFLIYSEIYLDSNDNINCRISSPKQNQFLLPVDSLVIRNNVFSFKLDKYKIFYSGKFIADSSKIVGSWTQDKFDTSLIFYRPDEISRSNRPQHPFKPYPYNSDSVYLQSYDSVRLAGTITFPQDNNDKYPTILLLNGIGPQDRNGSMYGHKPFLILSDFLTKNGYAVLRMDDRGVGVSSGNLKTSTTEDLAKDAIAEIKYLKSLTYVDTTNIGLIGFNEGGLIGSMVASEMEDIKFLVLLSSPGISGKKILINQTVELQKKAGVPENEFRRDLKINRRMLDIVENSQDTIIARKKLIKLFMDFRKKLPKEELMRQKYSPRSFQRQVNFMLTPWFKYYLTFNPNVYYEKVMCPVLVLYGKKDVQVDPSINMGAIETALKKGGNTTVDEIIFPNLNHLFQNCDTGLPKEYSKIKETFSPKAMDAILNWINKNIK